MTKKKVEIKELVLAEQKKGNIVFMGIDELMGANLDEFLKQPLEGILYDLNRLPEVVFTFIPDPKWVNDYAVYLVIKKLYERVQELEAL